MLVSHLSSTAWLGGRWWAYLEPQATPNTSRPTTSPRQSNCVTAPDSSSPPVSINSYRSWQASTQCLSCRSPTAQSVIYVREPHSSLHWSSNIPVYKKMNPSKEARGLKSPAGLPGMFVRLGQRGEAIKQQKQLAMMFTVQQTVSWGWPLMADCVSVSDHLATAAWESIGKTTQTYQK